MQSAHPPDSFYQHATPKQGKGGVLHSAPPGLQLSYTSDWLSGVIVEWKDTWLALRRRRSNSHCHPISLFFFGLWVQFPRRIVVFVVT